MPVPATTFLERGGVDGNPDFPAGSPAGLTGLSCFDFDMYVVKVVVSDTIPGKTPRTYPNCVEFGSGK